MAVGIGFDHGHNRHTGALPQPSVVLLQPRKVNLCPS